MLSDEVARNIFIFPHGGHCEALERTDSATQSIRIYDCLTLQSMEVRLPGVVEFTLYTTMSACT